MRFRRLNIPAFGPFTNFDLPFSDAGSDFHLIYGPNEAGKSSLLRAIRDLLFGIHGQTPEDFVHDYKYLKLAGELQNRQNRAVSIQRRKGTGKTSLLDESGNPISEDVLLPFLGSVTRDFFCTMFGLGSTELRDGAQALLQGRGELGQALFSASLAGTPVHRILAALEAEAATLFKGSAKTRVTIRPAVAQYESALKASRQSLVRPEAWTEVLRDLSSAAERKASLDAELKHLRTRQDWLKRCLDALPALGEMQAVESRLEELTRMRCWPPALEADPDFVKQAASAIANKSAARDERDALQRSANKLRQLIETEQPDASVLAHQTEIDQVHRGIELFRQWNTDLAEIQPGIAALETKLEENLRELGLNPVVNEAESLRIPLETMLELHAATLALRSSEDAVDRQHLELRRVTAQIDESLRKLSRLTIADVTPLRRALEATSGCAESESRLRQLKKQTQTAQRKLEQLHTALHVSHIEFQETYQLLVPGPAVIRKYENERVTIEQALNVEADALKRLVTDAKKLRRELSHLEHQGTLPTEAALRVARVRRNHLWDTIRSLWLRQTASDGHDADAMADEFRAAMEQVDLIADQLRTEADAVARAEDLRHRISEIELAQSTIEDERCRLHGLMTDWDARWTALWTEFRSPVPTPAEMLEWHDAWKEFRTQFESWDRLHQEQTQLAAEISEAIAQLQNVLGAAEDAGLAELRAEAEQRVRDATQDDGFRRSLDETREGLTAQLDILNAALPELQLTAGQMRTRWRDICQRAALSTEVTPETALTIAERRRAIVVDFDARETMARQAGQKLAAIREFADRVLNLARTINLSEGEEHRSADPETVVRQLEHRLWKSLTETLAADERFRRNTAQLTEFERGLHDNALKVTECETAVARFCRRADAVDDQALEHVLGALRGRMELATQIDNLKGRLHISARGQALDEFIAAVRSEQSDSIIAELAQIDEQIQQLQDQHELAVGTLATVQAQKEKLEQSGDDAAMHRQEAVNIASRLRFDAQRFVRLQLAIKFLREQIEEFRRQNQQPLMARASALFRTITQGSFDGIATSFDDADQPVLVGTRNGAHVGVAGLSEGTRDQLYLALRLAAIELHQQRHEPMPVILDDLLLTFDDRRAAAVLPVLSELGRTSQVLLFTHHQHLAELAGEVLPADGVHHHTLS